MLRRLLPALVLLSALTPAAVAAPPARNIEFLANINDFPQPPGTSGYASCWGYVHGDGREYAVIGCQNGTAIYNVTNPLSPYLVGFINGPPSLWREMKSYRNWIYVVTEGLLLNGNPHPGRGLQIIRMTDPENPVLVNTYTATLQSAHTVSVDTTRALLYCNGTKYHAGGTSFPPNGTRILSLANPEAPVEVSWWPGGTLPVATANYVHDGVPIGNRYYASSIYVGTERILDVTNPATPTQTVAFSYSGAALTHNAWPDATGNWLYVTDEQNGQTMRVFDISNLADVKLVNGITSNPAAIVHNAHVRGSDLHLANYTEGIRVCDVTDPAHPAEFAWMDTWEGISGGFNGVWGVYPYFPSGTIIASDMTSGLYVYRVQRDYGILQVTVHDGASAAPGEACGIDGECCCGDAVCTCDHSTMAALQGIEVFLTTQGDSLTTPGDGIVRFAPDPGTHTVVARKFGFFDATATVEVTEGGVTEVQLALLPKPTIAFGGTIIDAVSEQPLEAAEVNLLYTAVHGHSNAAGVYSLGAVPQDLYRVEVRSPGHVALSYERHIGPGFDGEDYQLPPAASWDALETPSGWTVGATGDNAVSGIWTRVEPLGTGLAYSPPGGEGKTGAEPASIRGGRPGPGLYHEGHEEDSAVPGDVQPEFDRSPPPGMLCFVTGQGTNPADIGQSDVDGGRTSLTTPALNLAAIADPHLAYWRWFYGDGADSDWLATFISNNNGTTWVPVDTVRGIQNHWREKVVRVADYVTPTTQVRLRFVAADLGNGSIVEAGIDDLSIYAAQPVTGVPVPSPASRLALRTPAPNPSSGRVTLALELPAAAPTDVEVIDVAGRAQRTLHRGNAPAGVLALEWDGLDGRGRPVPAGLYFVRARAAGAVALARLVRIP